jgi:RimJ/RimL family protein N-acetyltransferase
MFVLDIDRLLLRDFKLEDFEPFYETSQDPEYKKFYSGKNHAGILAVHL